MMYNPRKEPSDYYKLAEWVVIKLCDKLDVAKVDVRFIAGVLAEEYNKAYDDAIVQIKGYR